MAVGTAVGTGVVRTPHAPGAEPRSAGGAVERLAWRIPLSSRRLFLLLAAVVAVALVTSGFAAAWVASRNADTISTARDTGLGVAREATEFRTQMAIADAEASATLISGGLESPESRATYEAALLQAGRALTNAGLLATDADAEDIAVLAEDLVTYAGLVETSRANSRQGFPVGAAYMNQARQLAADDMVPRAERLRRSGEQRVARAANSVVGPIGGFAIGVLVLAIVVLAAISLVLAGRTRKATHPAALAALAALLAALGLVTAGILAQGRELREAATEDIERYVAANQAASTLANMRVTEIAAVAAHGSGAPFYDQFRADADTLEGAAERELAAPLQDYVAGVAEVEGTDTGGDNRAAAEQALGTTDAVSSGDLYPTARDAAGSIVDARASRLEERFDAASDANVQPLIPIGLGVVAAALAVVAIGSRGRRYR